MKPSDGETDTTDVESNICSCLSRAPRKIEAQNRKILDSSLQKERRSPSPGKEDARGPVQLDVMQSHVIHPRNSIHVLKQGTPPQPVEWKCRQPKPLRAMVPKSRPAGDPRPALCTTVESWRWNVLRCTRWRCVRWKEGRSRSGVPQDVLPVVPVTTGLVWSRCPVPALPLTQQGPQPK